MLLVIVVFNENGWSILVTGGADGMDSEVKLQLFARGGAQVCMLDNLTDAGNLASLQPVAAGPRFSFIKPTSATPPPSATPSPALGPDRVMHRAA